MANFFFTFLVDCACLCNNIGRDFLDVRVAGKVVFFQPVAHKLLVVGSRTSANLVFAQIPEAA